MVLIRCLECGKQMSDSASKCPHCGAGSWQSAGYTTGQRIGFGLIFLFGFILMAYGLGNDEIVMTVIGIAIGTCSIGFIFAKSRK